MKVSSLQNFILCLVISILLLISCKSQSNLGTNSLPKVENYTYGELDLKVDLLGVGKEINVGKINENGTIEFNWPEIDQSAINESSKFMKVKDVILIGMSSYCRDDEIEENTENCLVVDTEYIYLYKGDRIMGILFPATHEDILKNEPANIYENLALGSSISWVYSKETCVFKANCIKRMEWEGKYNFIREKNYDIQLEKGWNMVQYDIIGKEEWNDEFGLASMEKKGSKKTVNKIPENMNWYIKMF